MWSASGWNVYLALGDRAEIQFLDRRGALLRLTRWEAIPDPVTNADRRLFTARRESFLAGESPERRQVYPALEDTPFPDTKPLYSEMFVDDDQNLWLQKYPSEIAGGQILRGSQGTAYRDRRARGGSFDARLAASTPRILEGTHVQEPTPGGPRASVPVTTSALRSFVP